MFSTLTVEVKPGANAAFEEFVKKFRDAAEQSGAALRWNAVSSESGVPSYSFTQQFGSFAVFAQGDVDLAKAYGAAEAQRLNGLLQDSAAGMSTTVYAARPDLSRPWPALEGSPAAALYIDLTVRLGAEARFESYTKKVIEATNATAPRAYWQTRQRVFGPGNNPVYRVVVVFPQWTDLDAPEKAIPQRMREHFGAAEAARLEAELGDALMGITQRLQRVRTDLARPPQ